MVLTSGKYGKRGIACSWKDSLITTRTCKRVLQKGDIPAFHWCLNGCCTVKFISKEFLSHGYLSQDLFPQKIVPNPSHCLNQLVIIQCFPLSFLAMCRYLRFFLFRKKQCTTDQMVYFFDIRPNSIANFFSVNIFINGHWLARILCGTVSSKDRSPDQFDVFHHHFDKS